MKWSKADAAKCMALYPYYSNQELLEIFPGRSIGQLKNFARKRGIRKRPRDLDYFRRQFLKQIIKNENGCWIWTGSIRKGYGLFSAFGETHSAHRWYFKLIYGYLPDPPLSLDHVCNNTKCVNPEHLQVLHIKDNILKGNNICAINSRKEKCKYGHIFDEINTYYFHNKKTGTVSRLCRKCNQIKSKEYRDKRNTRS